MKTRNQFRPRVEELERRMVPSTLTSSTNWSGYAVSTSAGAVSQVAGSWVVPAVSSSVSGYSSAWVGIDGFNSSTVEQLGTDSDFVNGQAHYYAWYEMYPAGSVNLSLAIHPGDTISASVSTTGLGQFVLSITDVTTGGSFATTQTSTQAQRSSAEWIQEAPSSRRGVLPLADFSTINFSGANATVNGTPGLADTSWSGSTLYQINMVTSTGSPKATTSTLSDVASPAPSSFSVTWVSSGSGGKGGGGHNHKSSNVPAPSSLQPTGPFSGALVGALARPQGTSPAFFANQLTTAPVTPPAALAPVTSPALTTVGSTFLVAETATADGQQTDQATPRPAPLPDDGSAPLVDPGASSASDGLPTPQPDGGTAVP